MTSLAPATNQTQRFQALTGIRCIAVCMVFIYHNRKYWRNILSPELMRFANESHIGVSLFFVLSGFLIAYTYQDKPLQSSRKYFKYYLIRCARILPLYWLILTAFYLDKRYGNYQFSALTYTLVHGFSDVHNLDGISQAWSLTVEMTFYLLAPLLYYLQKKHVIWLLLALAMLYLAFWGTGIIWQQVDKNPQRFFRPNLFLLTGTFPGRCTDFLAGMILAKAIQSQANWLHKIPYKTIIGFLTMFLLMFIMGWLAPDIYHHGYDTIIGMLVSKTLLPASMMLLLAGLIFERTMIQKLLGSKALVLLGNASFAFYLVHIGYVNLKLKTWYVLPDRNFVLLWLIAIVLYQFFEMPIYNICRKLLTSKLPDASTSIKR